VLVEKAGLQDTSLLEKRRGEGVETATIVHMHT
jgi:hypothetical protein